MGLALLMKRNLKLKTLLNKKALRRKRQGLDCVVKLLLRFSIGFVFLPAAGKVKAGR